MNNYIQGKPTLELTIHPIVPSLQDLLLEYFMLILHGGRDSGKTVAMIHLILLLCMTGNHKVGVFRAEESQLEKESIKAMICNMIYKLGLAPACRRIGRKILINNRIEIKINGFHSIIIFDFIGNNPEKLRGSYDGFDIFVFEELHQFSRRVLEVAIPTLERAKLRPHLLGTCNLETQDTYAYELIKMGGIEREEQGWQEMIQEVYNGDTTQASYKHFGTAIEMLYDQNPYLTKFAFNRIKALQKSNYEEYLIIYRNHPRILTDDVVFKNNVRIAKEPFFLEWDMAGNARLNDIRHTVYYGMDFGYNHLFVNIECVVDDKPHYSDELKCYFNGKIYITRAIAENHLQSDRIIDRIKDWMPEQIKFNKKTFGDCSRPDTIKFLQQGGSKYKQDKMNITPCYKWKKSNSKSGGSTLAPMPSSRGCVLDRIAFLQSYEIIINPHAQRNVNGMVHCDNIWQNFRCYKFKKDKITNIIHDEVVKLNDDVPDALGYALQRLIQNAYGINMVGEDFKSYNDLLETSDYLYDNFMTQI